MADSILARSRTVFQKMKIPDFEKTHVQILGAEDSLGSSAAPESRLPREAVLWMSVKHQNKKALDLWAKEIAACGTGGKNILQSLCFNLLASLGRVSFIVSLLV